MIEIALGIALFTGIILTLSTLILLARSRLVATGIVDIVVNDERTLRSPVGDKLLNTLAGAGLYLPSGCGGKGTCGQCHVRISAGGGEALPTEVSVLGRRRVSENVRLACQVTVREPFAVRIPEEVFGVKRWTCSVRSNRSVASYIKELVLELPPNEDVAFRAGGYIQVECPPYAGRFRDFDIERRFCPEWDHHLLWELEAKTLEPTTRAYSMANYPGEKGVIILNVRIATPPAGAGKGIPPGVVSSYLFGLKQGDQVTIAGPYGEFFAHESDREMVFIGGGAGMAPMRSHIFDQLERLRTHRTITYWYGARSRLELFYVEDFDDLAARHPNFRWTVALSEPRPEDGWEGPTGFVHQVVYDKYLKDHPAPDECEYYLCGPPLMIAAVTKMLVDLGVERERIMFDDFGG